MRLVSVGFAVTFAAIALSMTAQESDMTQARGNPRPGAGSVVPSSALAGRLMKSADSLQPVANALQWNEGAIEWTSHNNCITGAIESETGQYVGWYSDTSTSNPKVGDIYYVHVVVTTVGNACVGTRINMELVPPPNTYLAIDGGHPVQCWYTSPSNATSQNTANCPQSLSVGTYGYRLNPVNDPNNVTWPLAQGATIEVQVPVYSTAVMSGIATNTYLQGAVQAIDGSGNPWAFPKEGQFVFANSPSITYPAPSATSITNTTARTTANIFNHFTAGTLTFDIGTTTGYGTTSTFSVPSTWNSGTVFQDWSSLSPGTLYHWRARFGATLGADQTFTTTGVAPSLTHPRNDFSADYSSDILWRNISTGANYIYRMNGSAIQSQDFINTVPTTWQLVATGDFDGDGHADILWRNTSTGQNYVYLMNGATIGPNGVINTVADQNWKVVGTGDFDGDGRSDILWRNMSTGVNYIYLMNGLTILNQLVVNSVPDQSWQVAAIDDFSGDHKADILWRNSATGQNYMYIMNGALISSYGTINTIADQSWVVAGSGDFSGDGKADLVWHNNATGANYIYVMNGLTILQQNYVNTVPDLNWKIVAVGDFNGDGNSDILWRHAVTGQNYIYQMTGSAIGPNGPVNTIADQSWVAIGR